MTIEQNKQLIRDYLAELSGRDKPDSVIDRFVADQPLKDHIRFFEAAFPRYELRIEDSVAEGDRVAVRATFEGRHAGDFQGISATGKVVTIPVMLIYRISGGKIVEHWLNADALSLLQQLGAMPVPA